MWLVRGWVCSVKVKAMQEDGGAGRRWRWKTKEEVRVG